MENVLRGAKNVTVFLLTAVWLALEAMAGGTLDFSCTRKDIFRTLLTIALFAVGIVVVFKFTGV